MKRFGHRGPPVLNCRRIGLKQQKVNRSRSVPGISLRLLINARGRKRFTLRGPFGRQGFLQIKQSEIGGLRSVEDIFDNGGR